MPCQDSCYANVEMDSAGNPVLVVLVADGAGSAMHEGLGSERAIESGAAVICGALLNPEYCLDERFALKCVIEVRKALYDSAETEGFAARDYACTFLALVSNANRTLLFQIGDGGMVVDTGAGLTLPIQPMGGEYANQTYFVTDMDALDHLAVDMAEGSVTYAAAFSDGIQRLGINMNTGTPHAPFFAPFFETLDRASDEAVANLEGPLRVFLDSKAVNERTDDDKTLVLVTKRHRAGNE